MPKPTTEEMREAIEPHATSEQMTRRCAAAAMGVVDRKWAEDQAKCDRYRSALERIAGADLKRTSAGWLAQVAKDAISKGDVSEWIEVSPETLPKAGDYVLAHYRNSHGKSRRVRAMYVDQRMADDWEESAEFDEWEDLDPPRIGWYETADNADGSCWYIPEEVTHWTPLPAPPE